MTKTDFAAIHAQAHAAGHEAATGITPRAIVVGSAKSLFSNEIDSSRPMYHEPEGVCGFAWVAFKGGTKWANWAKKELRKHGLRVSPGYPSGLKIWISEYGQSMERKEAYARAYAKVLNDAGISAYADSRMD